jgi:hypothetical protein
MQEFGRCAFCNKLASLRISRAGSEKEFWICADHFELACLGDVRGLLLRGTLLKRERTIECTSK